MKRKRIEFPVSYVVRIDHWDWGYGFGLNAMRDYNDPYFEYCHLHINGLCVHPRKLAEANIKAQLTFMPDPKLDQARRSQDNSKHVPLGVGSLERRENYFVGSIALPGEMLSPILGMLVADKLKFVNLSGEKLRRHKTLIRSYQIDHVFDEDDVLSEE